MLRQSPQDGLQLTPASGGQPELPGVPTIPRRAQTKMPPILLQLSSGKVPSGFIPSTTRFGQPFRSFGPNVVAGPGELLLRPLHVGRVEPGPDTFANARSARSTCSVEMAPSRCAAARCVRTGSTADRSSTSAPTPHRWRGPVARLPNRDPQRRRQQPRQARLATARWPVRAAERSSRLVVIPATVGSDRSQPCRNARNPASVITVETAVLEQLQQMVVVHGEGVKRRVDRVPTPKILPTSYSNTRSIAAFDLARAQLI